MKRRTEYVAVDTVPPHPKNPKGHELAAIEASMDRFGYTEPALICERTGLLAAGHGRREVLIAKRDRGEEPPEGIMVVRGVWKMPVTRGWSSQDDTELEAYIIASNRLTMVGGWSDQEMLASILQSAAESERGLSGIGYTEDDVKHLVTFLARTNASSPDEAPPKPNTASTRSGDLWSLGRHRLLCGDARVKADYDRLLGGARVDLVLTDPPYGVAIAEKNVALYAVGRSNRIERNMGGDAGIEEVEDLWRSSFSTLASLLPPGCPFYVFGPQGGDLGLLLLLLLRECGLPPRHVLIWAKHRASFSIGRLDYDYQHEPIIYGWMPGAAHPWFSEESQTSLLEFPRPKAADLHPTMKPVELLARLVQNSSPLDGAVLDPFGGSGSTLMACEDTGRVAYLMEIDPAYCDVICARYQEVSGKAPVRASALPL